MIEPQYLLLVHSCVASNMLIVIFGYFAQKPQYEVPTVVVGPLFLFNIAWVSAIIAVLSSPSQVFSFCLWLTALAIFVTVALLILFMSKGFS